MGFDIIDGSRNYDELLRKVEPGGNNNFNQAYAFGLGMIMDFNYQYVHNFPDYEIDEDFKMPEYLHFVITCQEQQQGNVKQTDLDVLNT